jgi:hypothetical protein
MKRFLPVPLLHMKRFLPVPLLFVTALAGAVVLAPAATAEPPNCVNQLIIARAEVANPASTVTAGAQDRMSRLEKFGLTAYDVSISGR